MTFIIHFADLPCRKAVRNWNKPTKNEIRTSWCLSWQVLTKTTDKKIETFGNIRHSSVETVAIYHIITKTAEKK